MSVPLDRRDGQAVFWLDVLVEETRFLIAATVQEHRGVIATRNSATRNDFRARDARIFRRRTAEHLTGVSARLRQGLDTVP